MVGRRTVPIENAIIQILFYARAFEVTPRNFNALLYCSERNDSREVEK